jgi:dephospho-CoA kinase
MKVIITGPQCSGKTTIAKDLKTYNLEALIIDEDEEINRRNGGKSPSNWTDWNYKWAVLRPSIQRDILRMDSVIFLTSFFDTDLLRKAKQRGFKVIQLVASSDVLQKRNKDRMTTGIDDATYGWQLNMPYHKELQEKKLVDVQLDTDRPVKELSECILIVARLNSQVLVSRKLPVG